jgi:hypothetical protein
MAPGFFVGGARIDYSSIESLYTAQAALVEAGKSDPSNPASASAA